MWDLTLGTTLKRPFREKIRLAVCASVIIVVIEALLALCARIWGWS